MMKALLLITFWSMIPFLLWGQDTLKQGTMVVRKVYVGDMIPSGLDFLGNMGGATPGSGIRVDNVIIKGKVLRVFAGDSTPIRSAAVWVDGGDVSISTDTAGNFKLALPKSFKNNVDRDSIKLRVRHLSDWDTTITVLFASNTDDYIITRKISDAGGGGGSMGRRERRRELLKRIFFPWKWFQQKEKLPPRRR